MNRLSTDKRAQIIELLCEGSSMRAASRIADVSIITVMKLVVDIGRAAAQFQDKTLRNLPCKRVQVDEIWAFCYAQDKNVPKEMQGKHGMGSVWTWTAVDADTKLIASWLVGSRDMKDGCKFIDDLASRLAGRIQLTSDGHSVYPGAVAMSFGNDVDYAQLVKVYGASPEGEKRYSPATCVGAHPHTMTGSPGPNHISTSYAEWQNLTMRMSMRRFTRLTTAFSKKIENHTHMVALYFLHYNFVRIHKTLRCTPAMEAEVSDHVWTYEEVARLPEGNQSQVA
jgi:IS1 family transposase